MSLPSHTPAGFFVDLKVSAAAPPYLAASGFADCLARSVAQCDWWMSHRLLGTAYFHEPYAIQAADEIELNKHAGSLPKGDIEAMGYLYRVLTLCGLGISFTGISHHGSMGEHQISHYIDCFAGARHPGSLHGQQVGIASLSGRHRTCSLSQRDSDAAGSPTDRSHGRVAEVTWAFATSAAETAPTFKLVRQVSLKRTA